MPKSMIKKYIFLYLLLIIFFAWFSRVYQINIYGTSKYSSPIFLLCCLIWSVAFGCTLLYIWIVLKILKVKLSVREIHNYFAWWYILGTCINLLVYKYEYMKIPLLLTKTLFIVYKLYILRTRYELTIKKCIVFSAFDLVTELYI